MGSSPFLDDGFPTVLRMEMVTKPHFTEKKRESYCRLPIRHSAPAAPKRRATVPNGDFAASVGVTGVVGTSVVVGRGVGVSGMDAMTLNEADVLVETSTPETFTV